MNRRADEKYSGLCEFGSAEARTSVTESQFFFNHYSHCVLSDELQWMQMRDTWENKMRVSILLIAVTGFLAVVPANAQSGRGQTPDHVNACTDLRGGTKGLYGLCVAFCSARGQSVDLNDIASLKAAAPDISILREYNILKRRGDPEMPCFQSDTPPDDGSSGGDDPGGSEPPPPTSCPCWTGDELASIDGDLPPMDRMFSLVDCTALEENGIIYQRQVVEGYGLELPETVEGVAWASVDTGGLEPHNACYFWNRSGQRNFPLEQADAVQCLQEVASHCAAIGNP
jgi:hypothetical protein